ncbi:cortactin-binding protein 2-like, partial [Saccoglossus kowalevskii]
MVDKLSPDLDKLLSESEESLEIYEDHSLVTADLLNAGDKDGWTLVHFAASKGFRDCLEMLCNNNKVNVKKRDKQDRVPYDVATDVCRELLDNLDARKVKIVIDMKGDTNISSTTPPPSPKEGDEYIIGVVVVKPTLSWLQFDELIANALIVHSK